MYTSALIPLFSKFISFSPRVRLAKCSYGSCTYHILRTEENKMQAVRRNILCRVQLGCLFPRSCIWKSRHGHHLLSKISSCGLLLSLIVLDSGFSNWEVNATRRSGSAALRAFKYVSHPKDLHSVSSRIQTAVAGPVPAQSYITSLFSPKKSS